MRLLRKTAAVIAAGALFTGTAFADAGFTDIREGYWAIPYIQLAKDSSLIEGYVSDDGTAQFRPENYVTKQECLVMLYNTLKLADCLETEEDLSPDCGEFYDSFQPPESGGPQGIPLWARPYVSYALAYGICDPEDFSTEVDSTGRSGGYAYASRQLIAKWTSKALGCEEAAVMSRVYQDADSIDPSLLVYVDALYRHGIMQGNAGSFYPENGVKRSEMAAICTRLLGVRADEAAGTVTDYGMLDEDGSLKEGSVLYDAQDYLQSLSLSSRLIHHHGVLAAAEAAELTLQEKDASVSFHIAPDTCFVIDGEGTGLSSLQALIGSEIDLSWLLGGEPSVVIQTMPLAQSGYIRGVEELDSFTLLTLSLDDGTRVNYCMNDASRTEGKIVKNRSCRFIADGMMIVEMR
ncbi:MAG: S-layer homology domain-containing protein [Firmicutes bacterium]|nr:S-layer homology domain-containing protein [Bacillota bacterium]